jgi:FAD/FMN-containing dehydrogenase/Fe-S oxidoreductase
MRTVIDRTSRRPDAAEGAAFPPDRAEALGRELRRRIAGEVRFAAGDRALYATDASNYRQVPIGVVVPKSLDDVMAAVEACRAFDAPITPRGGGTSLAGQTCNTAVVIDFSKYLRRIASIDPQARLAQVEPGCVLDALRDAAEEHGLTFGPDPSTHSRNTLGGMIGNDSCGVHSIMAGRTADNVQALDILTYDGLRMTVGETTEADYRRILAEGGRRAEIYRGMRALWDRYGPLFHRTYPQIPRRVSGYENLDQLAWDKGFNVARALVGTEAGCALVLGATLNLIESPPCRVLALLAFDDVFAAADAVCEVLAYGPIGLEGIDNLLVDYLTRKHLDPEEVKVLPDGGGWLLAEFGADTQREACAKAERLLADFKARGHGGKMLATPQSQKGIWKLREDALAATAHVPGEADTHPGWEDSAVRREDLGAYLRELKALFHRHGYEASVYGHFGDGLVHCRVNFDLRSEAGVANWRRFLDEAADLVVRYGGSLSGEHGDGQARAELLEKMYGSELMAAQRAFKTLWDPAGRMNPGKVIDPYPITSNLRAGPQYDPPRLAVRYAYPEDGGDFARAAARCVGIGVCRQPHSDRTVMCPSYMATLEEKHSTRGRARLLFEMVHGGPLEDSWRSAAVEEALDLCLACKGCKRDCPVDVDMATYKSEFRAHHYAGRLRPRAAYAMGQIRRWSELARRAPWLANGLTRSPVLAGLAKRAGGLAQARTIPAFAATPFRAWWRRRPQKASRGRRVVLFPDTFNDVFRPQTAIAAVEVLETLGYAVDVPQAPLCCGRPLYDWGWLDQATGLWRRTLSVLRADIEAGTPVIGLEPACVSAFRDELPNLLPDEPLARRLSQQTQFLTEFLDREGRSPVVRQAAEALVQIHCHHHAVLDPQAEMRVLDASGVKAEALASGCCGMAGSFGFEAEKYEVSMAAAERVLLPAVRAADPATLILANGFSCREQIEQGSGRPTLHVAEVLARGL